MDSRDILVLFILVVAAINGCMCQSSNNCTADPPPCGVNQYCVPEVTTVKCADCNAACSGCYDFSNSQCKSCKDGYYNSSGTCLGCPDNTFGPSCNGSCHCLYGAADCNQETGDCQNLQCIPGWMGIPKCQQRCSNTTFGSGCENQCHCPPGDTCAPTNGLCGGGICAEGWSSAGCQNELPQLADPPLIANLTCENVTLTWKRWTRNSDRGNPEAVIYRYEILHFFSSDKSFEVWTKFADIPHEEFKEEYNLTVGDLEPDAFYRFRVDVRQKDDDKPMKTIMSGKSSAFVQIPCTEPTTVITVTPPAFTTIRPIGPHLLDQSGMTVVALDSSPQVMVSWGLIPNITTPINITLSYQAVMLGNCRTITGSPNITVVVSSGSNYNISDMLPWHEYHVQVTAHSQVYNITDFIMADFITPEVAPTGEVNVSSIQIKLRNKNGGQLSWSSLPCQQRGGVLRFYRVQIFSLVPNRSLVLTNATNETVLLVESLSPATLYGVAIVYVNSVGQSQEPQNLMQFTTLEDVPGPPRIQSVTPSSTSVNVTLLPPLVTNGELTHYLVFVSENEQFTQAQFQRQSASLGLSVIVSNLQPDTLHYIKAQASTAIGPGNDSDVVNMTTTRSVPISPTDVTTDPAARNQSCVLLSWSHTDTTPSHNMLGFNVSYTEPSGNQLQRETISTLETSLLICNLTSGRYYTFEVVAINEKGPSPPATLTTYTEQGDPPIPPEPVILNTTETTISLALDPVVLVPSMVSYTYLVFIHDVTNTVRKVRAVSTSNTTCPGLNEIPGRLVRNFTQAEITSRMDFTVGNGMMYGNYNNTALDAKHLYHIYFVISSYFEGICRYSYIKTTKPVQAVTVPVIQPAPVQESSTNITLIIVIVIICILIILAVTIIIFCWWRRYRNTEQNYEPYQNEKDDFNLKVVHIVDDYDPMLYWNTIHSLRESRYIIAGKEYLADDPHAPYINGAIPATSIVNAEKPLTFQYEFSQLPHNKTSTCLEAMKRENELKNRFTHLLPYDHSRVILDQDINDDGNYINANFIKGYKHQRAYIAAQSPFERDTVLDFWRMIYQYEIRVIVMMSKIMEDNIVKCTQYWPDEGRVKYGEFILDLISVHDYADYVIRRVDVWTSANRKPQQVYIFDLSYWPVHGVPDDPIPLLEMRTKVNAFHNKHSSPIVVHCGTGVSRTGVYIAIDSLLEQYEAEGRISVFSFIRKMRKDRPAMVRTVKQYIFIYEAIFEAMVTGNTRVGVGDLKDAYHKLAQKNAKTHHSFLHGQFQCLQNYTRKIFPTMCTHAYMPCNAGKNRFYDVVPKDDCRPILTTPGGLGQTDYINAVLLDSHRIPDHFILTQTPLHTTISDFWKLVYDYDVSTIVMMEPMKFEDDTAADYWPEDHMKQFEPFFVETTEVYQHENITIRNFKLTYMNAPKEHRFVRQFQFNAWAESEFVPKSKSMLLDVIDLVRDWQEVSNGDTKPVVIHCKDGATHSGLFIAVSLLCEKALDEGEIDVFHTVKHLKRRRTQIVDVLDQYRFCYKALWDFVNMRMPGGTLTERMSQTRMDQSYGSVSMNSDHSFSETSFRQ